MTNHIAPARLRGRFRLRATLLGTALAGSLIAGACAPDTPNHDGVPTTSSTSTSTTTSSLPGAPEPEVAVPTPERPSAVAGAAPWVTPGARMAIANCELFPADHVYRATVTPLSVLPDSNAIIATTGPELSLSAGFSSGIWEGSRSGIPFNVVDGNTAERTDFVVTHNYHGQPAEQGVPMPENPRFEGWPGRAWDKHLVVVDTATCESREIINVRMPEDDLLGVGGGRWYADAASTIDLDSNETRAGAATASGMSLLAGLVRYDEVVSGDIGHALSATISPIRSGEYVWPATSTDGRSDLPTSIPMGSWLRLRSDVDVSHFGPQARVVAEALRKHGAIVMDTSPNFAVLGDPDPRWDDADLASISELTLSSFEIVDASPLMVDPETHQMRTR